MGLCLIATVSLFPLLAWSWTGLGGILLAAAGLGLVIFVHELGHFAVARMCGVKCDKFMIGFDFGGLKLSRQWGETEYGIGVFPLGGYVKMFGQDDDPSKIAEQMEATGVDENSEFAVEKVGPDGKKRWVDRRSYQAKSVPQRMAIISAGVVMNMIFAVIFAFIAYGLGVEYPPCVISQTTPGSPAWLAGLTAGDEIVEVAGRKRPSFEDLMHGVTLGDIDAGVKFKVQRTDATGATGAVEELLLKPDKTPAGPKIGVFPPATNQIHTQLVTRPFEASPAQVEQLKPGDTIVAVDGQPVNSYRELMAQLVPKSAESVELTIARDGEDEGAKDAGEEDAPATEEVKVTVDAVPARRLGLVMTMGPITAVQPGSPAEEAGLKVGDRIVAVAGQGVGAATGGEQEDPAGLDPVSLAEHFTNPGSQVTLEIRSADAPPESAPREITVQPRVVTWLEHATPGSDMPIPALGLAYAIEPTVQRVLPGSPAAEAGIEPGDRIATVTITRPPTEADDDPAADEPMDLTDEAVTWPGVFEEIGRFGPQASVEVTLKRGDEELKKELTPTDLGGHYIAQRGLLLFPPFRNREVDSVGEQAWLALDKTWHDLTTVVRTVQKLATRQVSTKNLGGPITIAYALFDRTQAGFSSFLLLLTFLSANLAVLNFLPIPVLDGGHMVFLAYEGITGRPANEKLMIALHLVGMALLLTLMIYVTHNDILRFFF